MTWRVNSHRLWLVALGLLVAAIVAGVSVFTVKYLSKPQAVEIALASADSGSPVEVYLGGAVDREGIYTVGQDATLGDILQRAGVTVPGDVPLRLKVSVVAPDDDASSQTPAEGQTGKININSATAEELDSLSGIWPYEGPGDYRLPRPERTI